MGTSVTDAVQLAAPYVAGTLVVLPMPFAARRFRLPPVAATVTAGAAFGVVWCAVTWALLDRPELVLQNGPWRYVGLPPGVVTSWIDAAVGHGTFWAIVGFVAALWVRHREGW